MRNNPDIRFYNFTEDYSFYNLGELANRVIRKNREENKNNLTISAQFGLVSQTEFFNRDIASKDNSHYYLLETGEFAYNKSYSKGYPAGVVRRLDRYERGVVSTLYICFKPNSLVDSEYLLQYFESGKLNKSLLSIAQEGARNHGLLNISVHDFFSDIRLTVPLIEEQKKVAEFHRELDNKISLLEEKLENLKLFKKGLSSKVFQDNNWNEVQIGDLLNYEQPNKYRTLNILPFESKESYRVLTANKSILLGFTTDKHGVYDKGNVILFDDFTTLNKLVNFPFKVKSSALKILTPKKGVNLKFVFEAIQHIQVSTEDHKRHYISEYQSQYVKVPNINIQDQVASKLDYLNKKIIAISNKLLYIKEFKEGLLQQMFV